MAKADLHIHTTASDGTFSPKEIVTLAVDNNLSTISITDHDTFAAYAKAKELGVENGLRVLPGVEITSEYKERECHILGYCFDMENKEFQKRLSSQKAIRIDRAKRMVRNLNKMGLDLDFDDVLGEAGKANISRVHIAKVLVRKGYAANMQEVFNKYIGEQKPGYSQSDYISAEEIIALIKRAGGVAVIAHPGLMYLWEDLKFFLDAGIDGIECIHPTHNFALQKKYRDWAVNFGLLQTGGSDFHGRNRDMYQFGTVTVDDSKADAIVALSDERKKSIKKENPKNYVS